MCRVAVTSRGYLARTAIISIARLDVEASRGCCAVFVEGHGHLILFFASAVNPHQDYSLCRLSYHCTM